MQRPLIWVALALAGGIALAEHLRPHVALLLCLFVLAAVGAGGVRFVRRAAPVGAAGSQTDWRPADGGTGPATGWWLMLAVGVAGALLHAWSQTDGRGGLFAFVGQPVTLSGVVLAAPRPEGADLVWVLQAEEAVPHQQGISLATGGRVRVISRPQDVSVRGRVPQSAGVQAGDRARVQGMLTLPAGPSRPGGYDERARLRQEGIHLILRAQGEPEVTGPGPPLVRLPQALQRVLVGGLDRVLPGQQADLLSGLVLGDRSRIPAAAKESFKRAGVYHILVVSGAHVALVLGPLVWGLGRLGLTRVAIAWVALPAVTLYCLTTGAAAPVVRATVMTAVLLGAWLLRRQADPLQGVAAAALLLMVLQPAGLFSVGLQLSFAATLGILLLRRPCLNVLEALAGFLQRCHPLAGWLLPRYVREGLAVTLAAEAAVEPLAAHYFGAFSTVAPLTNLVVAPLVTVLMPAGLVAALLGALAPALAMPAAPLARWPVQGLLGVVNWLGSPAWAYVQPGRLPLWAVAITYCSLALVLCRQQVGGWRALGQLVSRVWEPHWVWAQRFQLQHGWLPLRFGAPLAFLALLTAVVWAGGLMTQPHGLVAYSDGAGRLLLRLPGGQTALVGAPGAEGGALLRRHGVWRADYLVLPSAAAAADLGEVAREWRVGAWWDASCDGGAARLYPLLERRGATPLVAWPGRATWLGADSPAGAHGVWLQRECGQAPALRVGYGMVVLSLDDHAERWVASRVGHEAVRQLPAGRPVRLQTDGFGLWLRALAEDPAEEPGRHWRQALYPVLGAW